MNKFKPKIIFFGTPIFAVPVLKALLTNFQVQAVVTAPDKPVGRKQILTPSPVAEYATKKNIPVLKPEKLDENFIKNHISLLDSNLFIITAYGKIIPQAILDIPKFGALNIHPSLLPKYRGPSPIQSAILNGDKVSGITIMLADKKMDHGPVVATKKIGLSDQDTFESLSKKLFEEGANLLIKIIPDFIAGKIKPIPQNDTKATYTKIITKSDGYFNLENPPSTKTLERMIRAYYPWPIAWTRWKGKVIKLYPDGLIQMEGKKPTKLENLLRGYPNFPMKSF